MVPLTIGAKALGVMRVDSPAGLAALDQSHDDILRAFASEAALAVQRLDLARAAAESEALKQADEAKTALMMSISHDLKTPLAGIKTSVSSLLDRSVDWTDEDRRAFLETIESQADYLNRAISDILDLNRIESGAVRPLLRRVAVRDLLEDAVERSGPALANRRVEITAPADLEATIDSSLVAQAIANLLDNAAKYSRPEGVIRLCAGEAASDIEISVEDEGPGIAPEDRPHVFDRFYRARRESTQAKGTGLGLALVKGFVSLSGGDVRVESSERGARFVLSFPRSRSMSLTA
jgi:two-component system sensor histidine kinase KdpD